MAGVLFWAHVPEPVELAYYNQGYPMHLNTLRIQNFRRLKNVEHDLHEEIAKFVGDKTSGKT